MIDYWNDRPEHKTEMSRKARKVKGVVIRCDGEIRDVGGEKIESAMVPPQALIFWVLSSQGSERFMPEISKLIGLPLVTMSLTPVMDHTKGRLHFQNQTATFLHRNLGADLPVNYFPLGDGFGDVAEQWCNVVGNVLIVRADGRSLQTHVIKALCDFLEYEIGSLFNCVRVGELHEGLPVTKKNLLDQITPGKWRIFLEEWKKEHKVEEGDEDEEDEDDYYEEDENEIGYV